MLDEKILIRLLELVESNIHTSASNSGLELRADNNSRMEYLLCAELGITDEEAEKIYWKYVKRLGE